MNEHEPPNPDRRDFVKKASVIVLGGVAAAVPLGAGLAVFLHPLRAPATEGEAVFVTTLSSLPPDGIPRRFSVVSSRTDAWNRYPSVPIGAVYVRRTADDQLRALSVVCPHAGCFVEFRPSLGSFFCPCHNSTFALTGVIDDPKSPSPRAMDELEVEIRNENEVWVKYQVFQPGTARKVVVA